MFTPYMAATRPPPKDTNNNMEGEGSPRPRSISVTGSKSGKKKKGLRRKLSKLVTGSSSSTPAKAGLDKWPDARMRMDSQCSGASEEEEEEQV